jgi:hypothetical protein
MTNPDPSSPPPPLPKKHGCFFYGCITSLILLLILALGGFLAARYGLKKASQVVAQYSDTNAVPLPTVQLPPEETKALLERVNAFSQALDAHTNAAPLVLTGPQVNAWLATRPEMAPFKGGFFLTLEGDQAKAQISLPLENLPKIPMLDTKGRYLNGSATFNLAITNGDVSLVVTALEVKGQPAPASFMAGFQNQNLAAGFNSGTNAALLEDIESLQVTNSTLVIQAKKN